MLTEERQARAAVKELEKAIHALHKAHASRDSDALNEAMCQLIQATFNTSQVLALGYSTYLEICREVREER